MENHFLGRDGFYWFIGVVEDRKDPEKLGRLKVRIYGYHTEDKTKLPTEDLPWSLPMFPVSTSAVGGIGTTPPLLVEGTWVVGFFRDADTMQESIIMGSIPGIPRNVADTSKGFNDPNGKYPKEDLLDESDVNRLARGDTNHVKYQEKLKDQANYTEVDTASGTPWAQPAPPFQPEYPYNHVFESESGHIKEFDDTPNNERINEQHTSGTFYEIDGGGNKVTKVVGDNYCIVAGSDYAYVKGTVNLTIDGSCNTYIKQNWNIKVDGDVDINILGKKTETVTKKVTETYLEDQQTNITGTLDIDASTEVDVDSKVINLN